MISHPRLSVSTVKWSKILFKFLQANISTFEWNSVKFCERRKFSWFCGAWLNGKWLPPTLFAIAASELWTVLSVIMIQLSSVSSSIVAKEFQYFSLGGVRGEWDSLDVNERWNIPKDLKWTEESSINHKILVRFHSHNHEVNHETLAFRFHSSQNCTHWNVIHSESCNYSDIKNFTQKIHVMIKNFPMVEN